MGRSRPVPIESVVAISVLAAAMVAGLLVLVLSGTQPEPTESLLASQGGPVPGAPATTAPVTTVPDRSGPATTQPPEPGPDPAGPVRSSTPSTTTTSTTAPPEEPVVACDDLDSETVWVATGDRSRLEAAAGSYATYVEVLTNTGDEPCRLRAHRCDSTADVRDLDGTSVHRPAPSCSSEDLDVVLEPAERRRQERTVWFPVPPGDYEVHARGHEGTTAVLPVRLDDRLPECDPAELSLNVAGTNLFREREEVREQGLDLDLFATGAAEGCTLRIAETRLVLATAEDQVEIVDDTERWSASTTGGEVRTHAVAAPADLEPDRYDGMVTLVLTGGGDLTAPFRLVVE